MLNVVAPPMPRMPTTQARGGAGKEDNQYQINSLQEFREQYHVDVRLGVYFEDFIRGNFHTFSYLSSLYGMPFS
jgi:hypothetical protein